MTTIGMRRIVRAHLRDQLEPLSPGRRIAGIVQIHQEQIERPFAQPLEDGVGGADEFRLVAFSGQQPAKRFEHIGLIVGNEHPGGGLQAGSGHVEHAREGNNKAHATRLL